LKLENIFVEYLVIGAIALFWIYPIGLILNENIYNVKLEKDLILTFLIPVIYVIGMIINYLCEVLLVDSKFRKKIKK